MKKREIETYMDAFMEGFWSCYCTMIDLIDDDDLSQEKAEPSQEIVEDLSETKRDSSETKDAPEVETSANSSKPKPRTGTNVPEPRNVPHAPEKPTKTPMPDVKPTHDKFVELFKEGKLPTEVAKALGVSPATAYNHMNKAKQEGELK